MVGFSLRYPLLPGAVQYVALKERKETKTVYFTSPCRPDPLQVASARKSIKNVEDTGELLLTP